MRSKLARLCAISAMVSMAFACGEDKEEDDSTPEPDPDIVDGCSSDALSIDAGEAKVISKCASTGKITVNLSGASSGQSYVISPFTTGAASVEGAGSQQFPITVEATGLTGASTGLRGNDKFGVRSIPDVQKRGALRAKIANRFSVAKGANNQAPGLWQMVEAYDKLEGQRVGFDKGLQLKERLLAQIAKYESNQEKSLNLAGGACPTAGGGAIPGTEDTEYTVVDGTKYCIVYGEDPLFATDKTKIKSAMDTITTVLADVVFKDQSTTQVSDFTFKPVIVFIDVDDLKEDTFVYEAGNGVIGFFHMATTDTQKIPYVFIAHDLDVTYDSTNQNTDATKQRNFYGTLAHEVFHTYGHYFKVKVAGVDPETVQVDEGMAHFIESLFGHGDKSWPLAEEYLGVYPFKTNPFFPNITGIPTTMQRGGAYSFMYYLISQKGGVNFSSGKASGGGGLDFFRTLATSKKTGVANLKSQFNLTWTEVVGNFNAALALDNTNAGTIADKFSVQAPVTTVTDLTGTTGKTFGFRFNNNGSAAGAVSEFYSGPSGDETIKHYHFAPFGYSVSGEDAKATITLEADGSAATVIRTK